MLIYNVTLKVDKQLSEEWLQWFEKEHAPEMIATNCFNRYRICRLLDQEDEDGATFVVQYELDNTEYYDRYLQLHAGQMQKKSVERFGDKVIAFRTLMEVIE